METISTDVLVIGGGAAAAKAAVAAASKKVQVDLVNKGAFGESGSSPVCLAGIASLLNKQDSAELFFQEWIRMGGYICDQNLVWEAIIHSPEAVAGIEAAGMPFITNSDGDRSLYQGVGQSVPRVLSIKFHGVESKNLVKLLRREAEKRGVRIHEGIMITRLLQKNGQVTGATGISQRGEFFVFSARAVVLAAGGANRLYPCQPPDIIDPRYRTTGDSFCLAFSAGADLIDMEFTQFRESPPGAARFGGRYLNAAGERFMGKYAPQALEKAPRYKVVEAIYQEMKAGRAPIIWEVAGIKEEEKNWSFARQYARQKRVEIGIDFQRVLGGVRINEQAETTIPGLFAAGESAGGVHGSGRLQGAAFLETQVFGVNAGENAAILAIDTERENFNPSQVHEEEKKATGLYGDIEPAKLMSVVQQTMWEKVGVVRSRTELQEAIRKLEQLRKEKVGQLSGSNVFAALEAGNLLLTAEMSARAALTREETRGSHIRSDSPATDDDQWRKHVCISRRGDEISIATIPVVTRRNS